MLTGQLTRQQWALTFSKGVPNFFYQKESLGKGGLIKHRISPQVTADYDQC